MQCPRCNSELPADARFCGMCGNKFETQIGGDKAQKHEPENPVRFFSDTTATTDKSRAEVLRKIAEEAMKSTPPPVDAAPAPVAPAAPAPAAAAEAPSAKPAFQISREDLKRALDNAALLEGMTVPEDAPLDVADFYKRGEAAGISRKTLGDALHKVSVQHVPENIRAPLTAELQPIKPSNKKLALVGGGVVLGILCIVIGVATYGDDQPVPVPQGAASGGAPVAAASSSGGAPAEKPRKKPGTVDQEALMAAWQAVGQKAQNCHEAARKKDPRLAGKVVFDVEWAEDGAFSKLEIKEDSVGSKEMLECVLGHFKAQAWPKPQGGPFAAELPLTFQVAEKTTTKTVKGKRKKGK